MADVSWTLRPATVDDRAILVVIHCTSMRDAVERTWGWDDAEQERMFNDNFSSAAWEVVEVNGEIAGMLSVEETPTEIWLGSIELDPRFQSRGLGTDIVRSLLRRGAEASKPVSLRVLHANRRARALYERLGFQPVREIETHAYLRADPPRG